MSMRTFLLLSLILSFSLVSIRAQILFKDPKGPLHFRINLDTHDLWKENHNGGWDKQMDLEFYEVENRDIPKKSLSFSLIQNSKIILQLEGTGQVYQLDLEKKTFKRLDKTFYRGNNFGAIRYLRNDTLFNLGGHGFWYGNNIETYFSQKTNEWELYNNPSDIGPKLISAHYGGYNKQLDLLSVIDHPNLYNLENNKKPFKYYEKRLNRKSWLYKGDLNVALLNKIGLIKFESTFLNGLFIFRNGPIVVIADPVKNEVFKIYRVLPFLNENYELSVKQDYLYSYNNNDSRTENYYRIKLDSILIKELKTLGKYEGEFYIKPTSRYFYQIGVGLFLLVAGFILGFFINKSKKSKSINSSPDSELSILDGLPEGAYEFLRASLLLPQGHQFSSQAFTELMGFSTYAYETQRQVRSKLIKSINSYFIVHYKMHDVIIRITANDDKRFSIYYISEEHYDRLKVILGI
jgi:hypothetical protein